MRRNYTAIAAAVLLASGSAPAECAFCMPGTAGQFAEMRTRTPVKYVTEPIMLSGTFVLAREESGRASLPPEQGDRWSTNDFSTGE